MNFGVLYVVCCFVPTVMLGKGTALASRQSLEQTGSTFQDDEEFEMFYDVLREISKDDGSSADDLRPAASSSDDDEREQDLTTTTTTVEPEDESMDTTTETEVVTEVVALSGGGENLLEDSVDEVIADYEGGLVEIIRQAERQEEEGESRRVGAVVGAALGAAMSGLLLTVIGLVAVYLWKRRRLSSRKTTRNVDNNVRTACDFTPVPNEV